MDFTSALYLGLRHAHGELAAWRALTLGKPAALAATRANRQLARQLAALTGNESAVLAPSTLHLFWDIFTHLARQQKVVFFADSGLYPIARWGLERVETKFFPHHDPMALRKALARGRGKPIVVTDGFCPACGRMAPLDEYAAIVRRLGGSLIVDDTQALGVLGPQGGGSCRAHQIAGEDIMQISSLAKGFGAPLAVLGGGRGTVAQFREESLTQVHCSPPSEAAVAAGLRALTINVTGGDALRWQLGQSIRLFRRLARSGGIRLTGGLFPVQTVVRANAAEAHRSLLSQGIQTVLHRPKADGSPCLSFLITAMHREWEIQKAATVLAAVAETEKGRQSDVELAIQF